MSNINLIQSIQIDESYRNWLRDLTYKFKKSQIKAAARVNSEMLRFYWSIGRDISQMELTAKYGSGFYNRLSSGLKAVFPDISSFSVTNLKYMKYFYDLYADIENRPQLVDDFKKENLPQAAADLNERSIVFQILWGHHRCIINNAAITFKKRCFM